jgi:lysozyme
MSRLTASRAAFDLIASFEGFRTRAVVAPNGKWTLGFGHVATAREGLIVTRAEAEDLLRWDLLPIEDTIRQVALTPLSQNQFDALLSFAFNIGLENFKRSDVLKYLNQGQPIAAALSMHAWRRARVNGRVLTIDALVRRRATEAALFLEPVGPRAAAPTSIIAPEVDQAATLSMPATDAENEAKSETETAAPTSAETAISPQPAPLPTPTKVEPSLAPIAKDAVAKPLETDVLVPPALPPKATSIAQASAQDFLREPVVSEPKSVPLPSIPLTPAPKPVLPSPPAQTVKPKTGPIVPSGIAPFPSGPIYDGAAAPANTNGDGQVQSPQGLPANDGYNTRLHAAPEPVDVPQTVKTANVKPKTDASVFDGFAILTWALMALGAALLAFGLLYSWKSGLLSVSSQRREPTGSELSALLAAGTGFIMLITSAVAAITGASKETKA